jgi:hypothetical protein
MGNFVSANCSLPIKNNRPYNWTQLYTLDTEHVSRYNIGNNVLACEVGEEM